MRHLVHQHLSSTLLLPSTIFSGDHPREYRFTFCLPFAFPRLQYATMVSDIINRQFSDAFKGIANAYNAAEESDIVTLNQCVYSARGLLSQPSIPRHILIQTLMLLASILVDHDEARRYHREAEITLARVRAYESKDANRSADFDAVLRELQESLAEVGGYLAVEEEDMKASRLKGGSDRQRGRSDCGCQTRRGGGQARRARCPRLAEKRRGSRSDETHRGSQG
jgi:hypothetical protein